MLCTPEYTLDITRDQLASCHERYITDSSLRSELRFGQYVWNKYGKGRWTRLFYETDNGVAYDMLFAVATKE